MAEHEQPIHLYIGDQAMQGYRAAADAGAFNGSDTVRPIYRWLSSGTTDDKWVLPAPIVDLEWGVEHVLPQQHDTATLNFLSGIVPAKLKVCVDDADWTSFLPGGTGRTRIDTAIARAGIETMFFQSSGQQFLINGEASTDASSSTNVPLSLRRELMATPDAWEQVGTHVQITTDFLSSVSRDDQVLSFQGVASSVHGAQLEFSGGATRLAVTIDSTVYNSPTFAHGATATLNIVIDFRGATAYVYDSTGNELTRVTIAGDWYHTETLGADLVIGTFDGTVFAPRFLPMQARPRVDGIFVALWNDAYVGSALDPATVAEQVQRSLDLMRNQTWGAHAQVVLMMPPESLTGGDSRWLREAYDRAAAAMQSCTLIDVRSLAYSAVATHGIDALTGPGQLALSNVLQYDFGPIQQGRRYARRRRGTGYRRFAERGAAQAFQAELLEAGLSLREVSPVVGGPGQQAGSGIQMPWPLVLTQRGAADVAISSATGEYLVPMDRRSVKAGFDAPAGDYGRIAGDPRDAATDYPSPLSPATAASSPGTILSPVGWWRADLGHAVADAANVPAWANQGSDSSLDLAQGTGGLQPNYDEVNPDFNGQPSIHFAGSERIYSGVSAGWEIVDGGDLTIIVVMVIDTAAIHYPIASDNTTGGVRVAIRSGGASTGQIEDSSGTMIALAGASRSTGTLYIQATTLAGEVTATADNAELLYGGVSDTTASADLVNIRPSGGTGTRALVVGSFRVASGDFDGDIAEIIYHKGLPSAGEEADLVTYFNARYGTAIVGLV